MSFRYKGETVKGCLHKPTPSAENSKCKEFREKQGVKYGDTLDEVRKDSIVVWRAFEL